MIERKTAAKRPSEEMTYDRLSLAKQAAKGWLSKRLVGSIEAQMEKGLH